MVYDVCPTSSRVSVEKPVHAKPTHLILGHNSIKRNLNVTSRRWPSTVDTILCSLDLLLRHCTWAKTCKRIHESPPQDIRSGLPWFSWPWDWLG